jgi:5,10-methylene-tetrahydrofolate dehydrogenase/methenyl tetrahydrofolate cyclohydrolase
MLSPTKVFYENLIVQNIFKWLLSGMKALVVGRAGFVGRRLVERLLSEEHYVKVLDLKIGKLLSLDSPNPKVDLG